MAAPTDADGLVDDEGNLFGVVNVVDALALLLALAVLVAGVGLVLGTSDDTETATTPETDTTFVTLDLGTQPDYIVAALNEGDTYAPSNASTLTLTDIYLAPQGDKTRVLARARLEGSMRGGAFNYADAPPRLGRTLDISTDTYNVTGRIGAVGSKSSLDTTTTTVLLRETVAANDASEIAPGDEITVSDRTAATVEDVAVYPTTDPSSRQVLVEANLSTYTQQGTRHFGGTALRPGQQVTLPASGYTLNGRIDRVDSGLETDSLSNRTVTLEMTGVQPEIATAIRPGQTERAGGQMTAYITAVTTEPTPVVATAQNGSVVVSDHPSLQDVTLTTELRVRETDNGIEFRGERLQYGSTVVLDLGVVTVRTTVTDIDR
ncbi:DUF4330 family protein [Haloarcula onubensis]|uniref:DUF4330 domain-containing protein n=1 Tax=Haloarcula onubensis TaxID=2950539 RepID=A0ABU2FND1_9EURY|nr:DUF4330 family protein [Halomicroarcula sp. S3CR25-11]MDS0282268.1 DUF4330 domain-containing protein [Halomicroarcula sp. S3CR25-11]